MNAGTILRRPNWRRPVAVGGRLGGTQTVVGQSAVVAVLGCVVALGTPSTARGQTETMSVESTPEVMTMTSTQSLPKSADHRAQLNAFSLRVDALKRKVSGVEARVEGLKQTVLLGTVLATRARVVHRNEMSGSFRLEKAIYRLDGGQIFAGGDKEGLSDGPEVVLFDGPLSPGPHAVEVEMVFRGAAVGVFTYLQGYKFKVRSRYLLDVVEGRNTVLRVVAYEADDISVEAKERFKLRYDVEVNDDAPRPVNAP